MKIKTVILALFLAGCAAGDGCSGQRFTVVLSPSVPVEETAELQLAEKSVGFVESVTRDDDGVKATVRVQDLAQFSDADLFLPWKDGRGKNGLRVLSRKGNPLTHGAVVYATRRARRQAEEGPRRDEARREGMDREDRRRERPDGRSAGENEAGRFALGRGEGAGRPQDQTMRFQRIVERAFAPNERFAAVDTPGARRYQQLGAELAGRSAEEAAGILSRDGDAVAEQLRAEARQARESGDKESVKALRRMEAQLMRLQRQAGLQPKEPGMRGEGKRERPHREAMRERMRNEGMRGEGGRPERRGPRQFERPEGAR